MVKYDKTSGSLSTTAIGKIAAFYYINYESMQVYCDNLKPHMNIIDIFRLFSLSKEF
jgi:pre-mRNA-splicing helicase BRR2